MDNGDASLVSIARLANKALGDVDLLASLDGKAFPLPRVPLGSIAKSYGSKVGEFASNAKLTVDPITDRFLIYGDFAIRNP